VAAIQEHQTKRYDVFGDTMNGSILHPSELAAAHAELLDTWAFDPGDTPDGLRPAMPTSEEEWSLLVRVPPENYRRTVSSGAYFYRTFQHGDEDTDATADDFRIVALVSVLAGDPIPVERLLETYVARLREDDGDEFPSFLVASQFAQLCALARADLLAAPDGNDSLAEPPTYTEDMTKHTPTRARADGGESRAVKRDRKLEAFIKETPALRENHERRAAYLLGALVGQVSGYQQSSEGRSTTLVDQYSIDSMTKTRLKRTTHEVLDKDVVYSRENRMSSTMYAEVVDRLREAFTAGGDPDEWQIDTEDLRFYYSLGVTYGLNNWTEDGENEDSQ
jgi:CRISPR-associated protein Cas8b/Csh1 subtype I-B